MAGGDFANRDGEIAVGLLMVYLGSGTVLQLTNTFGN
jgi:hypothetical protein